jgi:dTMP kinase
MGRFIVLEGIDGSGKTTVAQRLHDRAKEAGHDVVLTREPTKTWPGDAVRRGIETDTEAVTEAFLFLADREAHTERIRAWRESGKVIVCDRYTDSTVAYQGARLEGRSPDPWDWLRAVSQQVAVAPDLTLLLRVGAATGMARLASRSRRVRFETAGFLEKVAANYDRLAEEDASYRVIDGERSVGAVTEDAWSAMASVLGSASSA